jgi:hypothetical protein
LRYPEVYMEIEVSEGVKAFNFWTLWVMGYLWESFPTPVPISPRHDIESFVETAKSEGRNIAIADFPAIDLMADTINWLMRESYISGKAIPNMQMYADMILTEKGLAALNKTPSSIEIQGADKTKSLGSLMREAAVSQGIGIAAGLVASMFKK